MSRSSGNRSFAVAPCKCKLLATQLDRLRWNDIRPVHRPVRCLDMMSTVCPVKNPTICRFHRMILDKTNATVEAARRSETTRNITEITNDRYSFYKNSPDYMLYQKFEYCMFCFLRNVVMERQNRRVNKQSLTIRICVKNT